MNITPSNRGSTTDELLFKYQYAENPVTKAVFRQIIGNRIDRALELAQKALQKPRYKTSKGANSTDSVVV